MVESGIPLNPPADPRYANCSPQANDTRRTVVRSNPPRTRPDTREGIEELERYKEEWAKPQPEFSWDWLAALFANGREVEVHDTWDEFFEAEEAKRS